MTQTFRQRLEVFCEFQEGERIAGAELYAAFVAHDPRTTIGRNRFTKIMRAEGFVLRNSNRRYWEGIRLKPHLSESEI